MRRTPDLAIEVPSSSGNPEPLQKAREYLDAGSRPIYVIAPQSGIRTVYGPDGSAQLLREHDSLKV